MTSVDTKKESVKKNISGVEPKFSQSPSGAGSQVLFLRELTIGHIGAMTSAAHM